MKKTGFWIVTLGAFALGYIANEYRHQQLDENLHRNTDYSPPVTSPTQARQQTTTNNKISAIDNHTEAPFSWSQMNELMSQQDYDNAIVLLKNYLREHPNDKQTWYWLAKIYQVQKKYTPAVEAWFKYLEREDDANLIDNAIGSLKNIFQSLVLAPLNSPDTEIWLAGQINKLLDISINDSQLHLMLAQLYLKTEDEYQAQYHALMAATDPQTQTQAENILAQLNGTTPEAAQQIPLTRFGEQYIVQITIEGVPTRLLLDTGASISGVSQSYIEKHPQLVKLAKPIRLNTASGIKDSYLFTVDQLTLGSAQFFRHILAVLPMEGVAEFDGLLGVDVLGKFDFVINQNTSTLELQPRPSS